MDLIPKITTLVGMIFFIIILFIASVELEKFNRCKVLNHDNIEYTQTDTINMEEGYEKCLGYTYINHERVLVDTKIIEVK